MSLNDLSMCIYKTFADEPGPVWTTALELLFTIIICVLGIRINCVFINKLEAEKRSTPLNRKGNVIEPLMSFYSLFQIIYWPYNLLFLWIMHNEVIPAEYMNGWWCFAIYPIGIKFGRMYIAYNSLLVALIRYLYIVHHKKSNQWEFAKVGKLFRIASILVPVGLEIIGIFSHPYNELQTQSDFKDCIAFSRGLNGTENITMPDSLATLTKRFIPEMIVIVVDYVVICITVLALMNIIEGFLYYSIYRSIKK